MNQTNGKKKNTQKFKPLRELTLMDRFLFDLAMSDPQNMQDVLSLIFSDRQIPPVHMGLTEASLEPYYDSRAVRLDLLAFDADQTVYDAEAQPKNIGGRALRRRSRAYQAYIDVNLMEPGDTDYGQLNDVYVIFISPFDLFGQQKYIYTFRMKCDEDPGTALDDGAVRIYLNTHGQNDDEVSEGLVEFLHYMEKSSQNTQAIKNPLVQRLAERIEQLKNNQEVSVKYMLFRAEYIAEAKEEAKEEIREEVIEELREELREELQNKVREEVQDKVREELRVELQNKVREEVQDKVREEVREELQDKVREEVRVELQDKVREEVRVELQDKVREEVRVELQGEGACIQLIKMVCRKLLKGKTAAAIADELDEDFTLITNICQAAARTAPEYDYEDIYAQLQLPK